MMPRWVKKPSSSEGSACYLHSACCLRTRNQCTSAAVSWMCYSRSFKTQATHFTRINVFSVNCRADDSAASTAGGSPSVAVLLELARESAELRALRELNAADCYCVMSELV